MSNCPTSPGRSASAETQRGAYRAARDGFFGVAGGRSHKDCCAKVAEPWVAESGLDKSSLSGHGISLGGVTCTVDQMGPSY